MGFGVYRQQELAQERELLEAGENKINLKAAEAKEKEVANNLKETNKLLCKNLRQKPNLQARRQTLNPKP